MPRNDHVGTLLVALGRVVEDHVEDDFDAGLMEGANHLLKFLDLPAVGRVGRIRCVGREVAVG